MSAPQCGLLPSLLETVGALCDLDPTRRAVSAVGRLPTADLGDVDHERRTRRAVLAVLPVLAAPEGRSPPRAWRHRRPRGPALRSAPTTTQTSRRRRSDRPRAGRQGSAERFRGDAPARSVSASGRSPRQPECQRPRSRWAPHAVVRSDRSTRAARPERSPIRRRASSSVTAPSCRSPSGPPMIGQSSVGSAGRSGRQGHGHRADHAVRWCAIVVVEDLDPGCASGSGDAHGDRVRRFRVRRRRTRSATRTPDGTAPGR